MAIDYDTIDAIIAELRNEHRLKRSVDYAYTIKYDEVRVLCREVYVDPIRDAFAARGITIKSFDTY